MRLINALPVSRILSMDLTAENIPFVSVQWFAYAGFSCFLVLFAGLMSGLTLGLVELEILQRSRTDTEKKQDGKLC
ncbi:hypothetical protein MLD38_039653 [Melastoma candidum]|uniref:Uncharacterized protein n=1 Tax=Melastoma candidum TaxID=119954 RepID=A0ACB9L375_9MYRT|nr:hypothetical protein MLD38_039653 [Melastoma candidum]